MAKHIWISTAPSHASNMRPLRHDFSDEDTSKEARLREIAKEIKTGEPLDQDEFPKQIFGATHATEADCRFPDLFYAYGFWVVTKAAADVLSQFDLGQGRLFPVKILKNDRSTPVEGEFFCLNFGNSKESFDPDRSTGTRPSVKDIWRIRQTMKDGELVFNSSALTGPDIWVEPKLTDAVLLSAGLGAALRRAKADKGFFLKKARVECLDDALRDRFLGDRHE